MGFKWFTGLLFISFFYFFFSFLSFPAASLTACGGKTALSQRWESGCNKWSEERTKRFADGCAGGTKRMEQGWCKKELEA